MLHQLASEAKKNKSAQLLWLPCSLRSRSTTTPRLTEMSTLEFSTGVFVYVCGYLRVKAGGGESWLLALSGLVSLLNCRASGRGEARRKEPRSKRTKGKATQQLCVAPPHARVTHPAALSRQVRLCFFFLLFAGVAGGRWEEWRGVLPRQE